MLFRPNYHSLFWKQYEHKFGFKVIFLLYQLLVNEVGIETNIYEVIKYQITSIFPRSEMKTLFT